MRRTALLLTLAILCSLDLVAQSTPQFQPALPGYTFEFPRDHGSHDEYGTEWWYYTGHLRSSSGKSYGFEVTFFRVGVAPAPVASSSRWDLKNVSLAHFAISDLSKKEFRYSERLNRSSRYTADATTGYLRVFNESWSVVELPNGAWRLRADAKGDQIDLTLTTRKPPAVHGENGVSQKAEGLGYATHYYSMSRLAIDGAITSHGKKEHCSGLAWMDHEFGSSSLRESQQGWDWFSVQLDNEAELMLYIIRKRDGGADTTSSGSIILADGRVVHLTREQFRVKPLGKWHSEKSGATYPMGWRVVVPGFGIDLTLHEALRDQELVTNGSTNVTYWEGAVDVAGRFGGASAGGVGYVEMTGYDTKR